MSEHHIVTPATYLKVLIALAVLMVLTIAAAEVHFGEPFNLMIALAIAVTKAVLIVLFFMHVKYSSHLTWVFVGAGFFWFIIMVALTTADYLSRGWHSPFTG
ncbi:MAG TPA: cytochrome C oxidase subunit IV family protein [Candidatus Hydrogenedentes bacterium]|nr:cytochrome C oxidase subunit IV family protein [Candidatus Hydrogenedentota bacterium]HNT88997.1 cytochrome C oxidase subunit IV family protein [Candidatus Hydrogenedentota bacterium]